MKYCISISHNILNLPVEFLQSTVIPLPYYILLRVSPHPVPFISVNFIASVIVYIFVSDYTLKQGILFVFHFLYSSSFYMHFFRVFNRQQL